jgi:multisubunit Na+/H+ antiporter MnhE subunit
VQGENKFMGKKASSFVIVPAVIVTMGCWVLFTGTFSLHELIVGAASTALTLAVTALAWRNMGILFLPTVRQVFCLWRLPWYVLHDSVEVSLILAKDMFGIREAGSHFRAVIFPSDPEHADTARAVLATTGTTMTPSTIVLGVADNRLLLHQLQRSPLPKMIADLGSS